VSAGGIGPTVFLLVDLVVLSWEFDTMQLHNNDTERLSQTRAEIEALDLSLVRRKLASKSDGHGWTPEHTDRVEQAYRRFLTLLAAHPGTQIAPTRDIDKFWHAHILDTRRYAADCERIFGEFLHHNPYLGMLDDESARDQAATALHALFASDFGDIVPANATGDQGMAGAVASGGEMKRPRGGEVGARRKSGRCGGGGSGAAWCGGEVGARKEAAWCGGGGPSGALDSRHRSVAPGCAWTDTRGALLQFVPHTPCAP
jgi:hypothetical protein